MEFKFLDYSNYCQCSKKFPKSTICFSHLRFPGERVDSYYLYINQNSGYGWKSHVRHHCLLTLKEIRKLIRNIQSYINFTYSIREYTNNKGKWYKIHLRLQKHNFIQLLFILTSLRYSYEYPFNVICKDAFKLQQDSRFKQLNLINTCNLIFKYVFNYERTVHSLCDEFVKFTPKANIRKNLANPYNVHGLFKKGDGLEDDCPFNEKIADLDFWMNDKEFETRKQFYLTKINKFKK